MEHEELRDKELSELEAALGGLLPRPSRLDRDRLLFLAGQASALGTPAAPKQAGGRHRLWPAVSAVSTAAAILFAVLLTVRPGPQVVREIVYVERPEASQPVTEEPRGEGEPAIEAFGPFDVANESTGRGPDGVTPSYLELRRRVFEVGLAALPEPAPAGGLDRAPATQREMLREFLGDQEPATAPARFLNWPFSIGDML